MLKSMDTLDVVHKLIGPVAPVDGSNADAYRFANLKEMVELAEALIDELAAIARMTDRHETSIAKAGRRFAKDFIDALADYERRFGRDTEKEQ